MAYLLEDVHDALGGHRAEAFDQRVGVEALEQLHYVVERTFVSRPEVEQRRRVRRPELRCDLGFALEASTHVVRNGGAALSWCANQLDGGRTREQTVARFPHLTHAARAKTLLETITSEL